MQVKGEKLFSTATDCGMILADENAIGQITMAVNNVNHWLGRIDAAVDEIRERRRREEEERKLAEQRRLAEEKEAAEEAARKEAEAVEAAKEVARIAKEMEEHRMWEAASVPQSAYVTGDDGMDVDDGGNGGQSEGEDGGDGGDGEDGEGSGKDKFRRDDAGVTRHKVSFPSCFG
jgi:hypothetical protein